jgi:2,5-furandicarboxylate decarboxylase 1
MKDLRTYLDQLKTKLPDQLRLVDDPISWKYDVTSHFTEMEKLRNNPALLFKNVQESSIPIAVNLMGTIERINLALDENSDNLRSRLGFYDKWNKRFVEDKKPIIVDSGPVKELSFRGSDVDLTSLPIPKFYEQDGGRYITAGLFLARNPSEPDEVNLSFVRMHLQSKNRFGVSFHSRGHMWQYVEKAKAAGEPLDSAVIIGAHPALYLAAAAKITNEYHKAGALMGEPMELVKCDTVDLPVPSSAEIILEGQVMLEKEDEGPFTEYTGYISGRSTRNLFKVNAITRRKDAIFMAVAPSNSAEHLLLSGLPKQARISRAMIDYIHTPALADIIWPVWGTHFACFMTIKDTVGNSPGLAQQMSLLLLGLDHYVKLVGVLPEGTDLSDTDDVLNVLALRCNFQSGSGVNIIGNVYSQWLDPSSVQAGISSKMILDATGPAIELGEVAQLVQIKRLPHVSDASFLASGNSNLCVIKLDTDMKNAEKLLDYSEMSNCRLIVCVDDDIELHDGRQVLWAIATRSQPADAVHLQDGRMVIDARKGDKWTATRATLPFNK